MDFEVLRPGKYLSTTREWTGKRLLTSVHPDVVDQFVLGLEWTAFTRTVIPETGVVCYFRTSNMFDCEVCDNLVERSKDLIARFLW